MDEPLLDETGLDGSRPRRAVRPPAGGGAVRRAGPDRRRRAATGALPPLPSGHLRRRDRPGARYRAVAAGAGQQPGQPRLSLLRASRLRQDHLRPHPGPLPQLRARAASGAVRAMPVLPRPGPRRPGQHRRDRDRRGQPRRGRRRPGSAGAGVLRPGRQSLQDLHRRRGPHGDHGGLQRPAQAGRGAAAARQVHLRHHRAGQGDRHHPLPDAPLPVPAGAAAGAHRLSRQALRGGGDRGGGGRAPAGGASRGRVGAGLALGAGPAARRRGRARGRLSAGDGPARLHAGLAAGRVRGRLRGG